jgi:solute carrier family 25 S-adenosylmethionine transporter 26
MMATLVFILKTQGIAGLYQGVVPYVVGDGLSGAVKFGTFEMTCALAKKAVPHKYHKLISFVCAAVAMLACSFVLVPTEVIKTRLQAGSASSVSQAVVAILQLDGFKGLYAGYFATLVRDIPYTMLELGIYENLKGFLRQLREQGKTIAADSGDSNDELLAAAITGGVSAFITTPLDLVKTKLMMQTGSNVAYRGVWDVITQLYSQGGLSGLFVGSAARVAWLLPFTTIYLGVYEKIKRSLKAKKERNLQKASDAP